MTTTILFEEPPSGDEGRSVFRRSFRTKTATTFRSSPPAAATNTFRCPPLPRDFDPLAKTVIAHRGFVLFRRPSPLTWEDQLTAAFPFRGPPPRLPACGHDPLTEDRFRPFTAASSVSKLAATRHSQRSSGGRNRCRITAPAILFRRSPPHLRQHDVSNHLAMILDATPRNHFARHHLSTMRRRAASASRSVLVFRRSRSCSPHLDHPCKPSFDSPHT